jgi:hypothetical protein
LVTRLNNVVGQGTLCIQKNEARLIRKFLSLLLENKDFWDRSSVGYPPEQRSRAGNALHTEE